MSTFLLKPALLDLFRDMMQCIAALLYADAAAIHPQKPKDSFTSAVYEVEVEDTSSEALAEFDARIATLQAWAVQAPIIDAAPELFAEIKKGFLALHGQILALAATKTDEQRDLMVSTLGSLVAYALEQRDDFRSVCKQIIFSFEDIAFFQTIIDQKGDAPPSVQQATASALNLIGHIRYFREEIFPLLSEDSRIDQNPQPPKETP